MIVLLFSRGTDLGGKAIEWYGHGAPFSHVDSVLSTGRLLGARSDVVSDAPAGVQVRDPAYLGDEATLRISLVTDKAMEDAYYAFLQAQIGKPYDEGGILAFISGRDWRTPDSWFCSELVAAALEQVGYFRFPLATPTNKMTPPDLILALSVQTHIVLP